MVDNVEIEGRVLLPIKEAAQAVAYSRDYVTRLAREGKVFATMVERQWFIDLESLKSYIENVSLEQAIRKKQLSEERKQERQLREVVVANQSSRFEQANSLERRAMIIASLVLLVGFLGGLSTNYSFVANKFNQVASVLQAQENLGQTKAISTGANDVELHTLGNKQEGILLLPTGAPTTTVSALFSDNVEVTQQTSGEYTIVMVDAEGKLNQHPVSFITVPVGN